MKKILLSMAILTASLAMNAAGRTHETMRSIAAAKLTRTAAVKGQRPVKVQPAALQCVQETPAYAIFTPSEGQGFVIVAKSDLVEPVLGYSTESFDAADMPDGLKWYLRCVSSTLAAAEARHQAPRRSAATYIPVENFVTTEWDQAYPYDRKTPNNFPSGCVATALAQCLNYCQYPPSAEFDGTFYVTTKQGKKEVTEKKSEHVSTTYTWPYKDTYKAFGRYGDNIDELLRDCGYATHMKYALEGSGTNVYLAGIALTSIFGYPEECVKNYEREFFNGSQDEWNQIIYDELTLRCPIMYGGIDPKDSYGHAFVFSGVDTDGLVYVNWGWSGKSDGFYTIELLNPMTSTGQDNYTSGHIMTTGIRTIPLSTDKIQTRIWGNTTDPYTFRWGTETDDEGREYHALFADLPGGFLNQSPSSFKGVFGLFAQDLTDGTPWVIAEDLQDRDTIPSGYGYFYSSDEDFYYYYDITGEKGLKPGHTYRMSFGTKDDREGEWHSIVCEGGELAYDITYTGDPETSTVDPAIKPVPVISTIQVPLAATDNDRLSRWYDLQGRPVAKPMQRGIYIRNGKRFLK